jgi:hypothetical protein
MSYQQMAPPPPPAPATTATPVVTTKIRPSAAWYWIGGFLIAAGIIGCLAILGVWAVRTSNAVDDFARMKVEPTGGEQGFSFASAGKYTLYYEYRSEVEGEKIRNGEHDAPSQLQITVTDANGTEVPVSSYDDDFSFSFNDKLGPAVAQVTIPEPGNFTVAVNSNATAPFVIAIGKGAIQSIWPWWALGALAALVVGLGLGILAIVMTAVKRGARKREQRRQQAAVAGYGYGVPATYPGTYTPAPAPAPGPAWTPPPSTSPGWDVPGGGTPEPAPPPASTDDPWGPPKG